MKFALGLVLAVAALRAQDVSGLWQSSLQLPGQRLRLGLEIEKPLKATMVSIDQGVQLPVSTITFESKTLKFAIPDARISFEGTLNDAGTEIAGTFSQGMKIPITWKKVDKLEEVDRPQTPKGPFPYDGEEVSFSGFGDGIKLGGTLTKPKGAGPFPAVMMLTGSGAQDRDETIFGHKPFAVIADMLTRQGFAVLRTDDRGVSKSSGSLRTVNIDDLAGDAIKGIEFLKARTDIDGKRLGLIGHSEGGLIAPYAASKSTDIAFLVLMAGPGVKAPELLYAQGEAIMKANGTPEEIRQLNRKVQELGFTVARAETDPAEFQKKYVAAWEELKKTLPEQQKNVAAVFDAAVKRDAAIFSSPLMRQWADYDPAATLRKLSIPVLALNGSLDLQVLPSQNLPPIAAALASSGSKDWSIVELPNLNHLFQPARTGSVAEYQQINQTLSPALLDTMSQWLRRVAGLTTAK
jgi:pimeloyl-ACP methyl ester carboxylesterase